LQSPVLLNVHNRYQDINLVSPVYFIDGGIWHVTPDHEIYVNSVMRNRIEFNPGQDILEGALVYNIQRMQHSESDISAHGEATYIQLLVAWHIERTKELHVRALLVEHDREFDWDEEKLKRLHQKYWHSLNARVDHIGSNWVLSDNTVLATAIKLMNEGYKWDIFISEGVEDNVERPLWIDTER
jgi:hypothetical protein